MPWGSAGSARRRLAGIGCATVARHRAARLRTSMISFPILQALEIRGYGMYPGRKPGDGLRVAFQPGLTLVLGANGLGKTTLVTMLFRMCAGTFDIPGLARGVELGNRSVEATELSAANKRMFAARVTDNADGATADLRFSLGETEIQVTRSLRNLAVRSLVVNDHVVASSERHYQEAVLEASGLSTFGDWILLLRHLVFYFEDRRALVWDTTAQRQILRLLFLPASTGNKWRALERDILERDSRMRNLQNALSKEEVAFKETEQSLGTSSDIRSELAILQNLQAIDQPRLDALNEQIAALDSQRQDFRLANLRAELDHEHAYRNLERLQLRAIDDTFPSDDDTAKYLFAKLFANNECLACGHRSPQTADELRRRLAERDCVVCGSKLDTNSAVRPLSARSIAKAAATLQTTKTVLATASAQQSQLDGEFDALISRVQELNSKIARRDATIDSLVRRLPPADADLIKQRIDLVTLRGRVEVQKAELLRLRADFAKFIVGVNRTIARQKVTVQDTFEKFAGGFLLEKCWLLWATHKARLGETGQQISFPAFELEMGGADFPSPVRRHGPDQVSESQREFIDLAFRMTLMAVAGTDGYGSLVIDAPESSLDAVFVTRAADVLNTFADPSTENRLVVTSNLIEGDLIPEMIRNAGIGSPRDKRVVDLLKLAAPTAATTQMAKDYAAVRARLFKRAREQ